MNDIQNERWRGIPKWRGMYLISDFGRVKSTTRKYPTWKKGRKGRLLKPVIKNNKYLAVTLSHKNRREQHSIHTLVLRCFICPKKKGLEACHNDGDRNNNHYSNLRWGTKSDNAIDRHKHNPKLNNLKNKESWRHLK